MRFGLWVASLVAGTLGWNAAAPAQTLERVAASGTLRIGYVADQAPFADRTADGGPVGYAIDLCAEVAHAVGQAAGRDLPGGLKVAYQDLKLVDAIDAVAEGRVDLLCGAITVTITRRALVDFSQPIMLTGVGALVGPGASPEVRAFASGQPPAMPRPAASSAGHRPVIGMRTGSTAEAAARDALTAGGYQVDIETYPNHAEGFAAVAKGTIDAYLADRALLGELLRRAGNPPGVTVGPRLFTHEPYGIALARGDDAFRLLVDATLSAYFTTPQFTASLERHFGPDAGRLRQEILATAIPN